MLQKYDRVIYDIISSYRPVESSILGVFINYINTKFPKNYFNETNISTALPLFNNKENDDIPSSNIKLNTFPQFNIEVTPSITESEFNTGDEWYMNQFLRKPYTEKIMEDWEGYKHIKVGLDRSVVQLNVQILEESEFRAIETSKFLLRALPFGKKTYLNKCTIGFNMPNQLIWTIANSWDVDLNKPSELEWFKNYMYNASNGCIRYTLDTASGQHMFTFFYVTNILMEIESVAPSITNEKNNKVNNYSEITFEVKLDLPTIPSLMYFQETTLDKAVDLREYVGETDNRHGYVSIPILALPATQIKYETNKFQQLCFYISIITDDEVGSEDVTDLSSIIPEYILEKWKKVERKAKSAIIWRGYGELPSEDFEIDDDAVLTLRKPSLRANWQYRIALYIDAEEFSTTEWSKLKDTTPFVNS